MNIFKELKSDIQKFGMKICQEQKIWSKTSVDIPKDTSHGDISCNVAMIAASKLKTNPRQLAADFKAALEHIDYVEKIEIAGPGFLNFTLKAAKWQEVLASILDAKSKYWDVNIGKSKKINIEYVSANPTGPMHIGHARGAVYGDALANILSICGYDVTKEYYINDAGSQIDTLLDSSFLRYKEAVTGEEIIIPEGLYPGDYLKSVGSNLAIRFGNSLLELSKEEIKEKIKQIVLDSMMEMIKSDLATLGVNHDVFFSEQTLHNDGSIDKAITILEKKELIYKGVLPAPKGKKHDEWDSTEQLLFKSTKYGDELDRAVQKQDGSWTYLAADFAYASNKLSRNFESLIYILGADHGGYVKRIKGVIDALSDGEVEGDIKISQLVNFVKDGVPIKMSKRSGNFTTVRDVTDIISKDIIRFIMLTRRSDMVLDFDLDKVVEQSKDNPVFYVQYAHVRTKSIIEKAKEISKSAHYKLLNKEYDLSMLNGKEETDLIKLLAAWPKILTSCAITREPHKVPYYLIEVATKFHAIWNLGKDDSSYRFNIENDVELTAARLAFAQSVGAVIASGLKVIGVTAMEKM